MRYLSLNGSFKSAICMWSTFNYLSTKKDINKFGESVFNHLTNNGLLIIDMPNHNEIKTEPYSEYQENIRYKININIHKRIVGKLCEALYQYIIFDKIENKKYLFCDQELHCVYKPNDVEKGLSKWFKLIGIYGDYNLQEKFIPNYSDRIILCLKKSTKLN